MKFIDKKYLLQQHRFVDSEHPIHEQRRQTQNALKRWVSILNRENPYDEYFMNWFCGFIDSFVFFKIYKKKTIRFLFLAYHIDYKLLRWVRYQFNFGFVYPSNNYSRGCYVVSRRSHLLILIEILNGYLFMKRTIKQFYIWLHYYNLYKNMHYKFVFSQQPRNLVRSTYLMGLMDCLGRFHIYRKYDKKYKFKYRIRFFFYMDIPITEIVLIKRITQLFVSPYLYVNSCSTIRLILSKIDDCSILSGLMIKRRPFNRYLKLRFINWYNAIQYLHFKNIKYRRKDRVIHLLYNFRRDYYYVRPRKKQPSPIMWYTLPEDIKVEQY